MKTRIAASFRGTVLVALSAAAVALPPVLLAQTGGVGGAAGSVSGGTGIAGGTSAVTGGSNSGSGGGNAGFRTGTTANAAGANSNSGGTTTTGIARNSTGQRTTTTASNSVRTGTATDTGVRSRAGTLDRSAGTASTQSSFTGIGRDTGPGGATNFGTRFNQGQGSGAVLSESGVTGRSILPQDSLNESGSGGLDVGDEDLNETLGFDEPERYVSNRRSTGSFARSRDPAAGQHTERARISGQSANSALSRMQLENSERLNSAGAEFRDDR